MQALAGNSAAHPVGRVGNVASRMAEFPPFWHPVDLWAVIDRNRALTSGTPGTYRDGVPVARGPLRRDSGLHEAIALEVLAPLRDSLARMVPRWIVVADDNHGAPVQVSQLVTSAPVDRLWARVLADPKLLRHTPPSGSAADTRSETPEGTGVFRGGLRTMQLQWMGEQDRRLWHVVRVTSPADPTTEEVAATLYSYLGLSEAQSHHAYAIVNAAPLFVLPKTWARDFPEAVQWATPEHASNRNESIEQPNEAVDVLLSSPASDDAALAQGSHQAAMPIVGAGHAAKDRERLAALLWKGHRQLTYLREQLEPWGLAAPVDAERMWLVQRADALLKERPAKIAQWAPVIEGQQLLVFEAAGKIMEVLESAKAAGLAPSKPSAAPVVRVLTGYTRAVAVSHLLDLARDRMAAAEAERGRQALSFVEDELSTATAATEALREREGQDFNINSDAAELIRRRKSLQKQKLSQRAHQLAGQPADPEVLEDLAISAGMVTVKARTRGLALQARQLAAMLAGAETGVLNAMAAAFDSRFETLPAQLEGFGAACASLERRLRQAGFVAEVLRPSETVEDRAADRRAERERSRQGLEQAKLDLAALPKAYDLHALNREALDTIHDHALIAAALQLAALIAASMVTSGAAAWLGGVVRGARLAGLAVNSAEAGAAARGARVAAAGVELASDAIMSSAARSAITGESFGKVGLENLLANAGVRAALQQLAPMISGFDDAAMGLWKTGGPIGKSTVALAKGTVVTGQLLIGAGVSYAVHRVLTHQASGAPPASAAELSDWVLEGTAMVVGHLISTRARSLQQRLSHLGTSRAYLAERAAQQQRRAAALEASGDHREAMQLMIEHRGLLADEARGLRELVAPGGDGALAAAHLSAADHRLLTRANADDLAVTSGRAMEELPFRFAGMEELVPGALWSGTHDQITTALEQSRAAGLDVHLLTEGNAQVRWRLALGKGRVLEIQERLPRPSEAKSDAKSEAKKSKLDKPERVTLLGDDNVARDAAYRLPPIDGYLDVFVHGQADRLVVVRHDRDLELSHRELATYLRKHALQGVKIRLVGCSTGQHPQAVAQHLANALGMEVLAPTHEVWVLADGRHGVGKKVGERDGQWQPFEPKAAKPEKATKSGAPPTQDQMIESDVDIDEPISVTPRRFDQRVMVATASPAQQEALRAMLGVPVIVDDTLSDGVRVCARRETRLLGEDLVVTEVRVGPHTLLSDLVAHTHPIAKIEKYNGTRGKLRQLADRLKAWKNGDPKPTFAHGTWGWATESELGKLESLLAARRSPLHQGFVDELTLREECDFLEGRAQFHREVLLSMEETGHGADDHLTLERPDVGQVTREAQAHGYRLPGQAQGVQPDWYYYRNNATNAGKYDLVRKPTAPLDAPALRPRIVGDTHTGFVPSGRREPTPLPDDKTPIQALRDTPGFPEYLIPPPPSGRSPCQGSEGSAAPARWRRK
jgi:hypothetical protein